MRSWRRPQDLRYYARCPLTRPAAASAHLASAIRLCKSSLALIASRGLASHSDNGFYSMRERDRANATPSMVRNSFES